MGTFGKVMALSAGAFGGMGLGFYLKEHYYLKQNKEKREQLLVELKQLRDLRKQKEEKLQTLASSSRTS